MATVFDKILDGEIPSWKVYEDEHVYSFLDAFPISEGHTLVIRLSAMYRDADGQAVIRTLETAIDLRN